MATRYSEPKYPHIKVRLVGEDGNAFAILGRVTRALRRGGASPAEVNAFIGEATQGDYYALLGTAMRWVDAR